MAVIGVSSSAFSGKDTITSVKFGSTCTYVGKDAFNKCISLSEINDDNVIEEIYDGAFANTKLSSVNFSKLKSIIGYGAFQNCSYLTDINIQSCKSIGENAFAYCENLKNVKINNLFNGNTISIGSSAFYNCRNLKNIDFKNCSRIGNYAFAGCTSIENANLNNCIKGIANHAFNGCTKLKEIHLSSCIIGSYAFFNCNDLSKVYINTTPEQSCISLSGDYIFYYNASQNSGSSPIWPKNLLPQQSTYSIISNIRFYLGADIFDKYASNSKWSLYKDYMFKLPGDNQILYTTENNEKIDIDNSKYGGISSHEYANNTGLIEFNESIDKLDQEIFKNNEAITSVYLPSMCSEVGENEFEGCTNLEIFNPSPLDVLKKIGNCAFKGCTSLESFTIPESIEELGEGIFAGCSKIENFEGKFTSYNGKAVVYNGKLICVTPKDNNKTGGSYYKISEIDSNIKSLGKYCFSGFEKLMRVDIIPSYTTTIGDFAFEGCNKLREVHFYDRYPSGSIEFGKDAFGIFKKDENENYVVDFKIFIPERLFSSCLDEENISPKSWIKVYKKYIYPEPFNKHIIYYKKDNKKDNKNYNSIKINSGEIEINSFGDNISKIIIGEGITKINSNVFEQCENLEYIYLPNSLTKIGDSAFGGCDKITLITLPSNLTELGDLCLATGSSKTIIYIPNSLSKPPIFTKNGEKSDESYPFGTEKIPQIVVPTQQLYNIYTSNRYWKKYTNNIKDISSIDIE